MSDLGKRLRQAREAAGLSLSGMAWRTGYSDGYLGNVETGVRNATPKVIRSYERVLAVDRRSLLIGVAASVATAALPELSVDIFRDIAAERPALLATVLTSHATDRAIGALVAKDRPCVGSLLKWARRGPAVLRINSVGILAKVGVPELDNEVIELLRKDEESRHLYLTAVANRVLRLPWEEALRAATLSTLDPDHLPMLVREVGNPYDSGARWCSLAMLSRFRSHDPATVDGALLTALKTEPSREMLRSIASVLGGLDLVTTR